MSTITINPDALHDFSPAALRLTRRGRVVVLAVFLALATLLMVAVSSLATASFDAGEPAQVRVVTVAPGDTLYGLAGDIAEPGKIREAVAEIKQLNSMSSSSLRVGDKIALPLG